MKRTKEKSILSTLFLPYTLLFIFAFVIIITYYVYSESKKLRESSFQSIENNLTNISKNLDAMADTLDTVSQNVIYSNLVKEHFASYVNHTDAPAENAATNAYNNIQNNKILYDLLVAMIGPNRPVDQIYLYGLEHSTFGVGLDNSTVPFCVKSKDWYEATIKKQGGKYLFEESDERLNKYFSYNDGQHFLTLCRVYYNSFNAPQGIIEIKKSMSSLVHTIHTYHTPYGENFYIFDANGTLVYPFNEAEHSTDYFSLIANKEIPVSSRANCEIKNVGDTALLYTTSAYTGFTTVAVVKQRQLLSPIFHYVATNLLLLLLTCACIVALSYVIARRIGTPLKQMYAQIRAFHIDADDLTEVELKDITTNITELHSLYHALIKMQTRAKQSMQHALQLQNNEMQARMLALQAQMNPHFLYNSLATIQAMADEGMTENIELMCQNISHILRYISSDSEQLIALRHEVAHTTDYLECMKIRYDNELDYTIHLPDELYDYQLPKLCLQLIVENAIKFTTQRKGPWHVTISGTLTETEWEIQVMDNGPGFDPTELAHLMQQIEEIDRSGVLPNLEINGMGLMNIYIRFKLLFNGKFIFRLHNHEPHGAVVTIGGILK
ncbi:MAG: histidine kinase [Eubacterium sp.]|nr:histidine kinase [Eubacterium sp.]